MKRRNPKVIGPVQVVTVQPEEIIDPKTATLNAKISLLSETSTFIQLGEIVGHSHEWVRERLVKAPERLYKIGRRYQVPRRVAEDFLRSVYI